MMISGLAEGNCMLYRVPESLWEVRLKVSQDCEATYCPVWLEGSTISCLMTTASNLALIQHLASDCHEHRFSAMSPEVSGSSANTLGYAHDCR
jgi:hypothetical protein